MSDNAQTSGIGFTGALSLVFIVLKLTHYIDWSWWWVLSPLWIGFLLAIAIFVIGALCVWKWG